MSRIQTRVLKWEAPPPPKEPVPLKGRPRTNGFSEVSYQSLLDELRSTRRRWARMVRCDSVRQAATTAGHLRLRLLGGRDRVGRYEFASRGPFVYGRYVGR